MSAAPPNATKDTLREWVVPQILAPYYTFTTGPCTIRPVTKSLTNEETCKAFGHLLAACEAGDAMRVRTILADDTRRRRICLLWDNARQFYSPLDAAGPHAEILQILIDKNFHPEHIQESDVAARLLCNCNLTAASMDLLIQDQSYTGTPPAAEWSCISSVLLFDGLESTESLLDWFKSKVVSASKTGGGRRFLVYRLGIGFLPFMLLLYGLTSL